MDDEPSRLILPLLILNFFLSAFFSSAEVALLGISDAKTRSLKSNKKKGSRSLLWLKKNPEKLIITILIGNNIANITATTLTTVYVTAKFGDTYVGLAAGILTLAVLIFGEILPKTIAQQRSVQLGLIVAPIIRNLTRFLFPLVWFLARFTQLVQKSEKQKLKEEEVESELIALAEMGEEDGVLETTEKEIIENHLEFADTTAEEVMIPRTKIDALSDQITLEEATKFVIEHSHSRLPIYHESIDQVVGIVTIRDLLGFKDKFDKTKKLAELNLRKPFFVPRTRKVSEAFKDFQKQKVPIAIVVDEHGGTDGLITMEDLIEEILGDIEDESDIQEILISKITKNSWSVDGAVTAEDLEKETGFNIVDAEDESKSISLLVLEKIGGFPQVEQKIEFDNNFEVIIEKMQDNKIDLVKIIQKKND